MLKSILNGMEALICVCDSESFEILFLNDSIRENFGIESDGVGQYCYKLLQHLNQPCESCPYLRLHENPEQALVWEHRERVHNRVLRKTARLIDWGDNKKAHLEYAIDITELRSAQEMLEHQNRLLQTANQVSAILLQSNVDDFEVDLLRSMKIIAEAADADRSYIWENSVIDGELFCSQIYEWSEGAEPQQGKELVEKVSYRDVLPQWEITLSQGHCINGLVSGLTDSERELLSSQGIISILVVPIFLREQFWGFVGFDDCRNERDFTEIEEQILRSSSELIANALIRNNLEKNIRHLETEVDKIYIDPLTGIYNRRYFDENMKQIISLLSRSDGRLSVMMVDIDHFKYYNDTYGHSEGDRCLKIIAETLRSTVTRADDFVARYGGEEFVVVLPNTDEAGARCVANKILEDIRGCGISHEKNSAASCVTVSIGIASCRVWHTDNADMYIRRADEMLYVSKNSGRNRSTFTEM
jgi:diguanylate cyclase (GGDEF)-like protein